VLARQALYHLIYAPNPGLYLYFFKCDSNVHRLVVFSSTVLCTKLISIPFVCWVNDRTCRTEKAKY
jgi:hypothetical protein